MGSEQNNRAVNSHMMKVETGDYGYVLEDVPHLTDYIDQLPVSSLSLSLCLSLSLPLSPLLSV